MEQPTDILSFLPEKWRAWALLLLALSPYLTRAFHALTSGGGLRGMINAIWFGTNVPKSPAPSNPPPTGQSGNVVGSMLLLLAGISLIILCVLLSGCRTRLEPGGAYAPAITNSAGVVVVTAAPDMNLFLADSSYDLAYSAALTVFAIEKQNRPFLRQLFPDLKHQMDQARAKVWQIDTNWAAARHAYLLSPVPANLTPIQECLADMQRWSATATALLPKPSP